MNLEKKEKINKLTFQEFNCRPSNEFEIATFDQKKQNLTP